MSHVDSFLRMELFSLNTASLSADDLNIVSLSVSYLPHSFGYHFRIIFTFTVIYILRHWGASFSHVPNCYFLISFSFTVISWWVPCSITTSSLFLVFSSLSSYKTRIRCLFVTQNIKEVEYNGAQCLNTYKGLLTNLFTWVRWLDLGLCSRHHYVIETSRLKCTWVIKLWPSYCPRYHHVSEEVKPYVTTDVPAKRHIMTSSSFFMFPIVSADIKKLGDDAGALLTIDIITKSDIFFFI